MPLDRTSIKVDFQNHGKLRLELPLSAFSEPPVFSKNRIHLVQDTSALWPLISGTEKVCMTEEGRRLEDHERFRIFSLERPAVANWVHEQLRGEFDKDGYDISVSEITVANCPAEKAKTLNDYGDHKQAVRCAGMDLAAPFYGKQDNLFHCDYGKVTGCMDDKDGVQVNLWLNLLPTAVSDFMLGFIQHEGEKFILKAGPFLETMDVVMNTNAENETRKTKLEDGKELKAFLEGVPLGVRVWQGLASGQALLFQSTGAEAVFHGCCRYADPTQQTKVPRMSMEYRFILKKWRRDEE
jgi:hypothetical protein